MRNTLAGLILVAMKTIVASFVLLTIILPTVGPVYCQQSKKTEVKDSHDRWTSNVSKSKTSSQDSDNKPRSSKNTQTNRSAKSDRGTNVTMDPLPRSVKEAPRVAR